MTQIPLEVLKIDTGYHILCRVHILGKEYRMLVDTGASLTMFDIKKYKLISNNELINNDKLSSGFGSGLMKSKYIIIDSMRIGDIVIDNYKMMLINLNSINDNFRENGYPLIDGILGGDILMKYKSIIDYNERELKYKI